MVSKRGPEFLWIGLALFLVISLNNEPVRALQEPIDEPIAPAKYQVPETDDPGTLERFMDALLRIRPRNGEEYLQHIRQMPPALDTAARKIMELSPDPESLSYRKAAYMILVAQIFALEQLQDDEVRRLLDEIDDRLKTELGKTEAAGLATQIAERLEDADRFSLAAEAYSRFGPQLSENSLPEIASHGKRMLGAARRLGIMGQNLSLSGTLSDGNPLDWSAYEGKVVYVDYWASWSGPSLANLPKLVQLREQYGDQGFEIVGICLDKNLDRVRDTMAENGVNWPCLCEPEAGWNHPMALEYGISKVPSSFLINPQGKVIAVNLRNDALRKSLAEIFKNPPENPSPRNN